MSEFTGNANLYQWNAGDSMETTIAQHKENASKIDKLLSESPFYDEITHEKYRDVASGTDYYITFIPKADKNGNPLKWKHGYQNDVMNSGNGETARSFAGRKTASFVMNASRWDMNNGLIRGIQIQDGVIQQATTEVSAYTLGISPEGDMKAFPPSESAQSILNQGYTNAVTGFYPIIQNGAQVDPGIYNVTSTWNTPEPRQVIARLSTGDFIVLSCEGRTSVSAGLTYADTIRILLARGVNFAYMLDGGGSTATVVRGLMINKPYDGSGKTERPLPDFLYIESPATFKQSIKSYPTDLGHIGKRITDVAADALSNKDGLTSLGSRVSNMEPKLTDIIAWTTNFDTINKTGPFWGNSSAVGAPSTDNSWGGFHWQADATSAMQIAIPFSTTTGTMKTRRTNGTVPGTWNAWRDL